MQDQTIITMIAILCVTALAIANLCFTGTDGMIITTVASMIAGMAGYNVKSYQVLKQKKKTDEKASPGA